MERCLRIVPICLVLALTSVAARASDDGAVSAESYSVQRQLEMMNALNRSELQLEYERLRNDVRGDLAQLRAENQVLRSRLEQRENDIGNYIDAISWVSGVVIGFVGVLFGIGAFILYRENQEVTRKAQEQLAQWNERADDLQNTFDDWFAEAKKKYSAELEQLGRIMRLRILLDQENPTAADIFPDLSPLYSNPKLEYLPIFKKVLTLDVGSDIKRSTQAAIDELTRRQRATREE